MEDRVPSCARRRLQLGPVLRWCTWRRPILPERIWSAFGSLHARGRLPTNHPQPAPSAAACRTPMGAAAPAGVFLAGHRRLAGTAQAGEMTAAHDSALPCLWPARPSALGPTRLHPRGSNGRGKRAVTAQADRSVLVAFGPIALPRGRVGADRVPVAADDAQHAGDHGACRASAAGRRQRSARAVCHRRRGGTSRRGGLIVDADQIGDDPGGWRVIGLVSVGGLHVGDLFRARNTKCGVQAL